MMKMTFLGPESEGRRFSLWRTRRRFAGRHTGFFCAALLVFSCELYTQPNKDGSALNVTQTTEQDDAALAGLAVLEDNALAADFGVLTFKNDSGEWVDLTESNFDGEIKEYKLNLNIGKNMTVIVARASSKDADVTFQMNGTMYRQGIFMHLPPARGVINVIVTPKNGTENIYTINVDRTVLDRADFRNTEAAFAALDEYLAEVDGTLEDNPAVGTVNAPLPIRALGLDLTNPAVFANEPVFKGEYNLYLDLDLSGCTVGTPIEDNESKYIFYRIDKNSIPGIEYIVKFALPESIMYIADEDTAGIGVFSEYTNLRDIHLPGVTKIGTNAFSLNTSLKTIYAPAAEEIGEGAFFACIKMTNIDMPKLTTVKAGAFASCIQLKSFSAPKIEVIENGAFAQCYALSELKFGGGGSSWTAIGSTIFENLPDSCLKQIKVYNASGPNAVLVSDTETYWGAYKDNQVSSLAQEVTALVNLPWDPERL